MVVIMHEQSEKLLHFSVSQNNSRVGRIQGRMIIVLFYYQGLIQDFCQGGTKHDNWGRERTTVSVSLSARDIIVLIN